MEEFLEGRWWPAVLNGAGAWGLGKVVESGKPVDIGDPHTWVMGAITRLQGIKP